MKLSKIDFIRLLPVFVGLLYCSLFFNKVHAQFLEPEIYHVELDIKDDFSATGSIDVQLRNTNNDKFLSAYEFTIPIKSVTSLVPMLNNEVIRYEMQPLNGFTILKSYFDAKAIPPNTAKTLKIHFTTPSILSSKSNVKQLYLPKPFAIGSVKNIKYSITYPATLGNPIFVDLAKVNIIDLDATRKRFDTNSSEGLLVVWGDSYHFDIEAKFVLKNTSDSVKNSLFNIIPSTSSQQVFYSEIIGAEFGLYDKYGNDFAFTSIEPQKDKEVGFSARINISTNPGVPVYPESYSMKFDYDSVLGKQVFAQTSSQESPYSKIKILNDYLVTNVKPTKDERISVDLLNDIWKRYETNGNLNSFELCSLMISFAESINLKGRMNYGYILLPDIAELDVRKPHVWCDVYVDDKIVLLDPLLESLTGVKYFDKDSNDRIYFGTWHKNQEYNNVLGLIGKSEDLVKLNFIDLEGKVDTQEKDVHISPNFPERAYSGEFYNATLEVDNKSSKIFRIVDVNVNDYPEISKITFNNSLFQSLLPLRRNIVELNNIREPDFLLAGQKEVEISLLLDEYSESYATATTKVTFRPDEKILIALAVVLIVGIGIAILFVRRRRLRRPHLVLSL